MLFLISQNLIHSKTSTNKIKINDQEPGLISTNDFSASPIKRTSVKYTQGIFFADNGQTLIESGGLYGQSNLVKMEYPSLNIQKNIKLDEKYFAEGVAKCGNFVYQLTWQERTILKYSYPDLNLINKLNMDSKIKEGWGLSQTDKSDELIASDGSSKIYFLDCNDNLKVKFSINVNLNYSSIDRINALCWAKGHIWANRYYDQRIFKIDPSNGSVVKLFDMSVLANHEMNEGTLTLNRLESGDVLNGIAYHESTDKFLITGKRWGYYYITNFK